MFCAACGTQLSDAAVVCPKCGVPTPKFKQALAASTDQPKAITNTISVGVLVASYVVGGLIPVIGWGMAIYLLVKGRVGHAIGVAAVSIVIALFWYIALNA